MDVVAAAVIVIGLIVALQIVHVYFFRQQKEPPIPCPKIPVTFPGTNALLRWYNVKHVNAIVDQFKSVQEVGEALQAAGLGACHLMFGKTNSHRSKDTQILALINTYAYSFYPRVIRAWNLLFSEVISILTLHPFQQSFSTIHLVAPPHLTRL